MQITYWLYLTQGEKMTKEWIEAIEYLNKEKQIKEDKEQEKVKAQRRIEEVSNSLDNYLTSEKGRIALEMLRLSNQRIGFGGEYVGHGYGESYFLDGFGLRRAFYPQGMWVAYSRNVPEPVIESTTALAVVRVSIRISKIDPESLITHLEKRIDQIAKEINVKSREVRDEMA